MKNEMVRLGLGTVDGAYILSSEDRSAWNKTRPLMKGESVNYMISSPEGRLFASTLSDGIFISDDSKKWTRSSRGLTVNKVWSVEQDAHAADTVYAGTVKIVSLLPFVEFPRNVLINELSLCSTLLLDPVNMLARPKSTYDLFVTVPSLSIYVE